MKAFADNKMNVTEKLKFVCRRIENIVGKEKMLVTCIFSFSLNVFKRQVVKNCDCVVKSYTFTMLQYYRQNF